MKHPQAAQTGRLFFYKPGIAPHKILVVEDEAIVAMDIRQRLGILGYQVAGTAASSERAIALAAETKPDLILMDIRLQGNGDGITAATHIKNKLGLPVVFLTAYAEDATLDRARVAEPFGYILKPFEDLELKTVIEMALARHQAERKLHDSERRYATTLKSIGDAVIATDPSGCVTFLNGVAETLTGWSREDAIGKPLVDIFHIVNETTRQIAVNPVEKVLREGVSVGLANHTVLLSRDGRETPIDDCASPIFDDTGKLTGTVLVFHDVTEQRRKEKEILRVNRLYAVLSRINRSIVRARSREEIFQNACRILVEDGGFKLAWVGWVDPETLEVKPVAFAGEGQGYLSTIMVRADDSPEGRGPMGRSIREGVACISDDLANDPMMAIWHKAASEFHLRSCASLPIRLGGEVRGAMVFYSDKQTFFEQSEIALLEEVATDVSFALDHVENEVKRRAAEQALATEQSLLNNLVTTSPDFIYFKDRNSRFVRVNDAWARAHRLCNPEEALGKTDFDFFTGVHANEAYEDEQQVMATGKPIVGKEEIETWPDGHTTWVSTTKVPMRDAAGVIIGIIGVSRDITDKKATERRLLQLSTAVEQSPSTVVITDVKGNIEYVNPKFTEITGYTLEEVVGKSPRVLKSGEQPPELYRQLWETILSGHEWRGQFRNRKKNGELYWETASISPIIDRSGVIRHFVAVKEDITARKRAEEQLLRSQRMESIGTLAGGIAHDLNNTLAPIFMACDILGDNLKNDDDRELLEAIRASAQRGAELVRQVLSFARGVEGRRVEVQPKHVIKDIERIVHETFPKTVRVETNIASDLWTLIADPTQLHQVLLNLCVNARDAMPRGGLLTLAAQNMVVDSQFASMRQGVKPGQHVEISVTDDGVGIPVEIRDQIFDPFFTTKEVGKGTGLGLSTVMGIVKSHGGFIEVESEPGRGTTFRISLPAKPSSLAEVESDKSAQLPRGNGELLLVVDDEPLVLSITRQTLEQHGYRVITASNGAEAVSLFAQNDKEVAVVMTDMIMPIMDGPATIHALLTLNPGVRIIAASGFASGGKSAIAAEAGVRQFLTKPYTARALLTAIHEVLHDLSATS